MNKSKPLKTLESDSGQNTDNWFVLSGLSSVKGWSPMFMKWSLQKVPI